MVFKPFNVLLAYDDARGHCGRIAPRMKELLEHRAFKVDLLSITDQAQPVDLSAYQGLVIGTPAFGLAMPNRGEGPTQRVQNWLKALGDLEELRCALFCVYELRPNQTLEKFSSMILDQGGQLIATRAIWVGDPKKDEHIIPAECMVRIR